VKIGSGNPSLARRIAIILRAKHKDDIRIQFVDESGTSALTRKMTKGKRYGTRDQRAAQLIAYREGQDFGTAEA
ncbi:MAG: hypothetical protein OK439_01960, partial [Thaumarchaeota archaeon]|nr:hypothetical protein [Nitrososphaerota archaeon]